MKKIAFFLPFLCIFSLCTFAQYSNRVLVKAGEDFLTKLAKQIYRFPQFEEGSVVYKQGNSSNARLNYNMLLGEMQFIDQNGDTLSLANEQTIDFIKIAKDSFIYDKFYLALVASKPSVKLAVKERIRVVDKQKIGAYDQPSSTGSIDSYNSVQSGNRNYKLDIREDVILAKETNHYIGDRFNHFVIANKKNCIKFGLNKQGEVEKYLRDNNVDFNNTEQLIKLIGFLEELKRG